MLPFRRKNASIPATTSPSSSTSYKDGTCNKHQQHSSSSNGIPIKQSQQQSQQQQQPPQKFYHLTPHAATHLPNFKYSGADLSLLYKHVLSPLAQFLVDHCTPKSIAPNVITLFGFGWMIVSYCIIWYYCPNLNNAVVESGEGGEVPRWIFLFNCIAMLIYQTLDNMDGKQARRTSSSSPLGLIFDHGCDAANSIIGSANWICAWGYNPTTDFTQIYIMVVFPMALFYVATWEEFYTGSLILPIVNGPSEGLLFGAMLSLVSFLWGVEFWCGTSFYERLVEYIPEKIVVEYIPEGGIRNNDLMIYSGALVTTVIFLVWIPPIVRKYGFDAFRNLLPLIVFCILTYVPFGMMGDSAIFERNPHTYFHLLNALFVEMVTQLMVDHVTEERYNPYRLCLAPLVVFAFLILVGGGGENGFMSDRAVDDYLLAYTVGMYVYLLVKIKILIHEICTVLKIWCFDITTPYYSSSSTKDGCGDAMVANGSTMKKLS